MNSVEKNTLKIKIDTNFIKIFYPKLSQNHILKIMAESKDLKVALGNYNEKQMELLRTFNSAIFPVKYAIDFYRNLSEKYTKLGIFQLLSPLY